MLTKYRKTCGRYLRTVKHLQARQIYKRIQYKISRPRPDCRPPPQLRAYAGTWQTSIAKKPSYIPPATMTLLNETHEISAQTIWNDPELALLWRYHLHYFDDLQATNAAEKITEHQTLIKRWIRENPPGIGCGWQSYPLSLRIVNWIKWLLTGNLATKAMRHSLSVQVCYLRRRLEYHLLGNHLLANAKALIFAGCYFQGKEADHWLNLGLKIYQRQLREQILADGGHFERSPMYHSLILEDLLDVINVLHTYALPTPDYLCQSINAMFTWLQAMIHPDGEIAFFNDSTLQQAPTFAELLAYAKQLGSQPKLTPISPATTLAQTGFVRVALDSNVLLLDTGSVGPAYLPGHAHAGTLSFELSLAKQRVLVNSGTSCYQLNTLRAYQRSTAAHNTLSIDGENSSEVWHRFRVGRRARVFAVNVEHNQDDTVVVEATHNGYQHLGNVIHHRRWRVSADEMEISDEITGEGVHDVRLWYHLHPTCKVAQIKGNTVIITTTLASDRHIVMVLPEDVDISVQPSEYYPQFGVAVANQTIVGVTKTQLPYSMITAITWKQQ